MTWFSLTTAQPVAASAETREVRVDADSAFDLHARGLYRFFAVRTGDPHLADDLMQQLWVASRTGRCPASSEEAGRWLAAIARNLLTTHWRRAGARPAHVPLADPALAAELAERLSREPLPLEELDRREVRDQLLLALSMLGGPDQDLVVAHYFEGRTFGEMAQRLGVSSRAVEGKLYRARQALQGMLRAMGRDWEIKVAPVGDG
jgi:RNA polymerase sigma-70 factor (ECF subfamily)